MTTTTWTQLQETLWPQSVEDGRAQAGVAMLPVHLDTAQSKDVMVLCQPEETDLQLRVWVSLAPKSPTRENSDQLAKCGPPGELCG